MERITYGNSGLLRTETPRIETPFGKLSYWQSLQFMEYGQTSLGGFEPPYDGQPGAERTIEVNRVPYSGSVLVYVRRDGQLALGFESLHPHGVWRETPSAAAQRKLEEFLMPLARELFPLPTPENIAAMIHTDVSRNVRSTISSYVHKLGVDVYRDSRYSGFSDVILAGVLDGLERAETEVKKERFEVNPY